MATCTRETVVKTENELQIAGEDKPAFVAQTLAMQMA